MLLEDLLGCIPKCLSQLDGTIEDLESFFVTGNGAIDPEGHSHQTEPQGRNSWTVFAQLAVDNHIGIDSRRDK